MSDGTQSIRWGILATGGIAATFTEALSTLPDAEVVAVASRSLEGAKEFAEHGCANCHGAPGVNWAKYSEGLHPDPPDLKDVVGELSPAQLFWVIKNGINMTGMPSFAQAGAKDDDIWLIVAYLKKLPNVSEADYKAWTAQPSH